MIEENDNSKIIIEEEDNPKIIIEEEDNPKIIIEIEESKINVPPIEEKSWLRIFNCISSIEFYREKSMHETNEIILMYNSWIPPHITIKPIPNIYSLWGITVFIIFIIYYIIWGILVLFISIIYCAMLFISMLFIIPYLVCIVVSSE